MQSKYFKFLLIALVVAVIVPQVTLASWYNPFSWGFWSKIFHSQTQQDKNQTAQPSITVTLPVAGAIYHTGDTINISWITSGITGNLGIDVVDAKGVVVADPGEFGGTLGMISANTPNNGNSSWQIPSNFPIGGPYIVSITAYNNGAFVHDDSGNFSVVAPTVNPTANWKTYTNTQYGFEVKYPSNLSFTEGSYPNLNYWYVNFNYNNNSGESPLAIRVEKKSLGDMSVANNAGKLDEKDVAGIQGKILVEDASGNCQGTFIDKGDWAYIFENQCNQNKNLFDQMLSTFKFTK
jgi:hypothetical protein